MSVSKTYEPAPIFLELGDGYSDPVEPARFPKHVERFRNQLWAERVGLGELTPQEWETHFARFAPLPGNLTKPLALRYHGHQFQAYNPELGDGRGFLFAQLREAQEVAGRRRVLDLGTKGSGQTPYSRRGDGRLTLKGAVREVLATEMLESLGVETSKTFGVFETGEELIRHDEPSPTRSAVLVRLNHSHVRFGTFQRLAHFNDTVHIMKLVDYCLKHYYPEMSEKVAGLEPGARALAFLAEVTRVSAKLASQWMLAGFVHGVLNTDNMNVTGESFDYGPYRFLPKYDPSFTAAYFDQTGLYAYGRQPQIMLWNLERLAESMIGINETEPMVEVLRGYAPQIGQHLIYGLCERLGLEPEDQEAEDRFFMTVFDFLSKSEVGFEQFFHDWYGGLKSRDRAMKSPSADLYRASTAEPFLKALESRRTKPDAVERLKDPYFERPRPCSMLIDEIEAIWSEIAEKDDWSKFEAKVQDVREMGRVYGRRDV